MGLGVSMSKNDAFFKCTGCGMIMLRYYSTRTSYCSTIGAHVKLSRMRLTPWFAENVKPVRVGWYETSGQYMVYWSGAGGWRWGESVHSKPTWLQDLRWRGLEEKNT